MLHPRTSPHQTQPSKQRHHRQNQLVLASFVVSLCRTGQSSVWGRWTISKSYYRCNYTHLRPPWEHNTRQGSAHKKNPVQFWEAAKLKALCKYTNIHTSFTSVTGKPFPFLLESDPRHPHTLQSAFLAGATANEALARQLWWICERLPHLTQIDPVGQKNGGSTCSKIANYHFKEVPRKG